MNRLIWSGFLAVLLVSGCGWNGTPTRHNDFIPLTSIKILAAVPAIEASHTIAALTSTKLTVIGDFSGIFTRDITDQVTWSSSNTPVADFKFSTTPNTNRISGLAAGTATLTATMGGVSATYSLIISNATVSTIAISPPAPSVPQGLTTQFSAIGTFSDTTTQDLTFDVAWSSSPGTFATISNASASKGFATALAAGTGTETISASFGVAPTTANASATMTVTAPALQSITVTPANPSILSLSTTGFKATGNFSDGTAPDITNQVTWSSSTAAIATITSSGIATTLTQGTAVISATSANVSGATNLKVTGGNLNSFTVSPATVTLVKDTSTRMTVTGASGRS